MQFAVLRALPLAALAVALHSGTSRADSPAGGWKSVETLQAAEAHQGAAADETFAYAITNAKVAKYDRRTGQRVAVSTGPAKHLNSGVFWQGKLFLAHSNYPRTPEQSEIKVLDPDSMQLATFHDFGNFGGSLTWACERDGQWWCNFARYGDDNGETFLARFDDRWRELGRWTYPPQVLRQIGKMSLSGGMWWNDSLLVTDHDHPRLYRLQLPKAGTVLEFIDTQPAPFTGQGIALDPKTGGLIGIDRVKRQLIFASREAD
ncbi:MAG: hypothetical protein WD872_08045 [Pirellulaceae bacterium]